MNIDMHGKKINRIYFPVAPGLGESGISSSDDVDLIFSATHHGDCDEFWILVIKDGIEISRYNARYIEGIEWL